MCFPPQTDEESAIVSAIAGRGKEFGTTPTLAARMRRGVRQTGGPISMSWESAPDTDTGELETSSDALLDELARALAREIAERDYAALRTKPRRTRRPAGGTKDSR